MKICITGSSGFIGQELCARLKDRYEIVMYDLAKGQDVRDYAQLAQAFSGCEVVVHLAAHRKPYEDKSFEDYFRTNVEGTFHVARAARDCGVRKVIFSSSTSYYGIEEGIPFLTPIREANQVMTQHVNVDRLSCRDCDIAYSTSKVIAEQILANYGLTKKFQTIILRLGPTRKRGEYRPFGKLKLHLKIENALQAITKAIALEKTLWYEAFTITDALEQIDLEKAKQLLGYEPE